MSDHATSTGCALTREDFGTDTEPCADGGKPSEHPRGVHLGIDQILEHYIVALRWSETHDEEIDGEWHHTPFDAVEAELAPEAITESREFIVQFLDAHSDELSAFMDKGWGFEQIGHDLALTRNGHGAGFWDRGAGDVGRALTEAVKPFGEAHLILGDDGLIHTI